MAPRFKNGTASDVARYCCCLSQHSDARVRKEASLREMWTPHEVLNTQDGTLNIIFADLDSIQTDDELSARS